MARKTRQKMVSCFFYQWILYRRPNGMYYADGRGNALSGLARYSLGTANESEAVKVLHALDRTMAVKRGKAAPEARVPSAALSLSEGVDLYLTFVGRPVLLGGARPVTLKRYGAILDKFLPFCKIHGVETWEHVTKSVLASYGAFLEQSDYAYATQHIELATLNQVLKYLAIESRRIPAACYTPLKLKKPDAVTRYCYTFAEVTAMVEWCTKGDGPKWLRAIIIALATTGMRIEELSGLRWSDLNLLRKYIMLPDTSRRGSRNDRATGRTTKGGYSRSLPIHPDLLSVLHALPRAVDGKVFHGPQGGRLKPDTVRNVLVREVLRPLASQFPKDGDAVGFVDGRLHSFRHYFVSAAAHQGISEPLLMSWLGHRSSEMVRRYYHANAAASQEQISRLKLVSESAAALPSASTPHPTPSKDA